MRRAPHLDLHRGDLLVKRLLVAALSLALVGTGAACNSDSTGPGASLAGTYTLRTVNNQSPPVTLCDNLGCFAVLGGQLQLDANGNFVNQLQLQNQGSASAYTQTTAGYWVVSGNQISFVDNPDNVTLNGSVSNSTITIIDTSTGVAVPLVYTR
jgi:hypothetical protein